MKPGHAPARAAVAVSALALALVFQGRLLFGGSLHHFDWLIHWHYYDWVRIGLQEYGTLSRFMVDAWHTANFVANAQSPVLGPLVWLLAWLPTEVYVKLLIALYTAIGVAGAFALARDLGARPAVAACATVLWCCSGFFAAHVAVGHHWSLGAYWLPWIFLAMRRARDGSRAAWLGVTALQALPLLEGQHHPFLWQNGLLLLWLGFDALRARTLRPLAPWLTATLLGVALAGVRVVPLVLEFADYAPEARIGGLPLPALGFSLLSRAQGPETAGHGVVFAHGSGWWEYTFYLGALGLAFVVVGAAAAVRERAALLAAGGVAGLLCLDGSGIGLDPWALLEHVPVLTSQRAPSRLLVVTLFAGIFAAVVGWERLLAGGLGRRLGARGADVAFGLLALILAVDLVGAAQPWQAAALGPQQTSRPHRIGPPELVSPAAGRVRETRRTPNRLEYRVEAGRPGFLVLPIAWDRYGPDWQAGAAETVRSPQGWLAVRVAEGESDVRLHYRTPGLWAGGALSGLSLLAVAGLVVRERARRRAPTPPR